MSTPFALFFALGLPILLSILFYILLLPHMKTRSFTHKTSRKHALFGLAHFFIIFISILVLFFQLPIINWIKYIFFNTNTSFSLSNFKALNWRNENLPRVFYLFQEKFNISSIPTSFNSLSSSFLSYPLIYQPVLPFIPPSIDTRIKYLLSDVLLGIVGIFLTYSAAITFKYHSKKHFLANRKLNDKGEMVKKDQQISNKELDKKETQASGTLDPRAVVTYGEMVEHLFYQALNLTQVFFLHCCCYLGSTQIYYRRISSQINILFHILMLFFITAPWFLRKYFPVNSFSANYSKQDEINKQNNNSYNHKKDDDIISNNNTNLDQDNYKNSSLLTKLLLSSSHNTIKIMYRIKKYQYVFYKHFLLHCFNLSICLTSLSYNYYEQLYNHEKEYHYDINGNYSYQHILSSNSTTSEWMNKLHQIPLISIFPSNSTSSSSIDLPHLHNHHDFLPFYDLVLQPSFRLYWLLLNLSYVMEFFLQTLVKKDIMTQRKMMILQRILMFAASLPAINLIFMTLINPFIFSTSLINSIFFFIIAILSILLNFSNRGQDVFNTFFLLFIILVLYKFQILSLTYV